MRSGVDTMTMSYPERSAAEADSSSKQLVISAPVSSSAAAMLPQIISVLALMNILFMRVASLAAVITPNDHRLLT